MVKRVERSLGESLLVSRCEEEKLEVGKERQLGEAMVLMEWENSTDV